MFTMFLLVLLVPLFGVQEEKEEARREDLHFDEQSGTITFSGIVRRDSGRVQFLIYTQGYSWLEEESAIVSEVSLKDLQLATAQLDWKLFDKLWFGTAGGSELSISVEWMGERIPSDALILNGGSVSTGALTFWGSPYFDHIVLGTGTPADCFSCPIFPLEQRTLRETFSEGYELDALQMPPIGTRVDIIMEYRK